MPEIIRPNDGAAQHEQRIRELERQVAALASARRVQLSTIAGGQRLVVTDENDDTVVVLGQRGGDSDAVGVEVYSPGSDEEVVMLGELAVNLHGGGTASDFGALVQDPDTGFEFLFITKDRGVVKPVQQFPWQPANDYRAVTSATYTTVWQSVISEMPATGLRVQGTITADAATTGDVRLEILSGHSPVTSIAAGSSTNYDYKLDAADFGVALGAGPIWVSLQARRTAGAGNINVYRPYPTRTWDTDMWGS